MVPIRYTGDALWERIERAVQKVKDRLRRVVDALEGANVPYAVIGGNAVQLWVAQVDEAAVRNTRDVDIVLNRCDLERATVAVEAVGLTVDHHDLNAVHVFIANEKVRSTDVDVVPGIDDIVIMNNISTLPLESLVRMKLTVMRHKDAMHLIDMIDVELIDATWLTRFDGLLQTRLQEMLDAHRDEQP